MSKINKKKQFLLLTLFSLILFSCTNENIGTQKKEYQNTDVSIDLASKIAINFSKNESFTGNNIQASSSKNKNKSSIIPGFEKKDIDNVITISDESNTPAFYAINFKPNGFVIIAATKKETPILAYSETGNFKIDSSISKSGLSDWIELRKKRIEYLKKDKNTVIPPSLKDDWVSAAPPDGEEVIIPSADGTVYQQVGPLLKTTWGQGERYNDLIPYTGCDEYSNSKPPTGCVATAMAQIMRYHNFPKTYNWSIMPNSIGGFKATTTGTLEIAKLMLEAGSSVFMRYLCDGSQAKVSDARTALINTFGYSNQASFIDYNSNVLEAYIIPQLDHNQPILFQGFDATYGGHAWVCDGYKRNIQTIIHNPGTVYEYTTQTTSAPYLRMNWGWDSRYNGWYLNNVFNPYLYNYNGTQKCIINIHP